MASVEKYKWVRIQQQTKICDGNNTENSRGVDWVFKAYKEEEKMSTEETTANQTHMIEVENAEMVKVNIATHRRSNSNKVGIGVTAMIEGDVIVAAWATHERSYNCP